MWEGQEVYCMWNVQQTVWKNDGLYTKSLNKECMGCRFHSVYVYINLYSKLHLCLNVQLFMKMSKALWCFICDAIAKLNYFFVQNWITELSTIVLCTGCSIKNAPPPLVIITKMSPFSEFFCSFEERNQPISGKQAFFVNLDVTT